MRQFVLILIILTEQFNIIFDNLTFELIHTEITTTDGDKHTGPDPRRAQKRGGVMFVPI
jgi:hypothetical protein